MVGEMFKRQGWARLFISRNCFCTFYFLVKIFLVFVRSKCVYQYISIFISMSMYRCIYMYICMYICMYVHICVYLFCTFAYLYHIVYNCCKNGHFNISLIYLNQVKHACIFLFYFVANRYLLTYRLTIFRKRCSDGMCNSCVPGG